MLRCLQLLLVGLSAAVVSGSIPIRRFAFFLLMVCGAQPRGSISRRRTRFVLTEMLFCLGPMFLIARIDCHPSMQLLDVRSQCRALSCVLLLSLPPPCLRSAVTLLPVTGGCPPLLLVPPCQLSVPTGLSMRPILSSLIRRVFLSPSAFKRLFAPLVVQPLCRLLTRCVCVLVRPLPMVFFRRACSRVICVRVRNFDFLGCAFERVYHEAGTAFDEHTSSDVPELLFQLVSVPVCFAQMRFSIGALPVAVVVPILLCQGIEP